MRNFCTLFDSKYRAKGLALLASLRRHMPESRVFVLALDRETYTAVKSLADETFELSEISSPALETAKANRTYQEFTWTLGSVWTDWAARQFNLPEVAYLDADIYLFADLAPLYAEAKDAPCAVIPHRWTPKHAARLRPNGLYNVSWVWFNENGVACLDEWARLCLDWCYYRNEGGQFADQGYWDTLAPKYGAHIVKHLGANLAPWSAEQYTYHTDDFEHRELFVSETDERGNITRLDKLLFFHFHNWQSPRQRSGYELPQPVVQHCYIPYEAELMKWT